MKYGFKVDTWFWDDIKEEILCRPLLMQRFYDNKVREIEQLKDNYLYVTGSIPVIDEKKLKELSKNNA